MPCIKDLETSESLGIRLGESVLEEFDERFLSTEAYVLAFSCISNAFAQLGRTSEDSQFVTVCAHARRWCIGQAKAFALMCDDQSAAMEVVSRVTGIVDLDEPVLLEQGSGRVEGTAERTSGSTTSGADNDEDLWTAFWEGRCPDVDSLSRLRAEVARSTTARGCDREERMAAREVESRGVATPVVAVPETAAPGHSSDTVGIIYSDADSRHGGGEGVASTATSSLEARDVPASSASAAEDPTPKRRMKRAQFDEAVPLRRNSRIAERSRPADAGAPSGHRRV